MEEGYDMNWEDEIRKEIPLDDYMKLLSLLIHRVGTETQVLVKTYKSFAKLVREQKDYELMRMLEPVLKNFKSVNDDMLDVIVMLEERYSPEETPSTEDNLFDEDEWRRQMR